MQTRSPAATPAPARLDRAGPSTTADCLLYFAGLAAVWGLAFFRLSFIWETSDQYSHGWFVPFLAGWIFWRRWATRPAPHAARGVPRLMAVAVVVAALLPLGGANLVLESSPDWRMMMWLVAGSAFAASLALTFLAGGLPWFRHLFFPLLFALVAAPWPYDFETWLTVELSMVAARITTAVLNLLGILAVCQGNTIEISAGLLGVEDACSGVRSFQSSFVVALLLGEWFRLRAGWRAALCLMGLVVAYALNIARMLVLSIAAEWSGIGVVEKLHDPAGFAILIATLAVLWLACSLISRLPRAAIPELPETSNAWWEGASCFGRPAIFALLTGLLFIVSGTEFWYRQHEGHSQAGLPWTIAAAPAGAQERTLDEAFRRNLGFDVGLSRSWKGGGRSWELIYMRWEPGRKAAQAGPHAPDYCQKAVGRTVLEKSAMKVAVVNGTPVPYQIYTIAAGAEKFHLLFAMDDGRRDSDWLKAGFMGEESTRAKRLARVREGRRNIGQASLQVVVVGSRNAATAEQELLAELPALITMDERQ